MCIGLTKNIDKEIEGKVKTMKFKASFAAILLLMISTIGNSVPRDDFPVLKGPYLGQKAPGKIPIKFPFDYMPAGYRLHSAPAFMPGGEEVYFSAMDFSIRFSEKIFFMKIVDGT